MRQLCPPGLSLSLSAVPKLNKTKQRVYLGNVDEGGSLSLPHRLLVSFLATARDDGGNGFVGREAVGVVVHHTPQITRQMG